MATGITKMKERVASLQRSSALQRVKRRGDEVVHTLLAAGTAYAVGTIEKNATTPLPTIFGLDPKLTWGGFAAIMATGVSGKMGAALAAISDGLLTSYGYAQGLGQGYVMKGEEGDDLEGDF